MVTFVGSFECKIKDNQLLPIKVYIFLLAFNFTTIIRFLYRYSFLIQVPRPLILFGAFFKWSSADTTFFSRFMFIDGNVFVYIFQGSGNRQFVLVITFRSSYLLSLHAFFVFRTFIILSFWCISNNSHTQNKTLISSKFPQSVLKN